MSDMVDRVSQVLWKRGIREHDGNFLRSATVRAAIEAMREPTEAMWKAPAMADACVHGILPTGEEAEEIWQAMIDEALK